MTTTTRERPILFATPLIPRLLDGSKTQTRRIVKPQPNKATVKMFPAASGEHWIEQLPIDMRVLGRGTATISGQSIRCPFGAVGDRLWVRETFWVRNRGNTFAGTSIDYKDGGSKQLPSRPKGRGKLCCWRPSIHMPRWASRIDLEITEVRVERVNDISREDALAEGVPTEPYEGKVNGEPATIYPIDPVYQFCLLWSKIHGIGSWKLNPWVWVLSFRRIKP